MLFFICLSFADPQYPVEMKPSSAAQMEKLRLECDATGCEFKTPKRNYPDNYPAMVAHLQVAKLRVSELFFLSIKLFSVVNQVLLGMCFIFASLFFLGILNFFAVFLYAVSL